MAGNQESAFKVLNTNNGDPDSTVTLRNLLLRILKVREQSGEPATIDDLLNTHNMFLSSSFKPFISTSSIYLKNTFYRISI